MNTAYTEALDDVRGPDTDYVDHMVEVLETGTGRAPKQRAADDADAAIRQLTHMRARQQELFGPWDDAQEEQFRREVYFELASPRIRMIDDIVRRRAGRASGWTTLKQDALYDALDAKLLSLALVQFDPQRGLVESPVGFARLSLENFARSWKPTSAITKDAGEMPELAAPAPAEREHEMEDRMADFERDLKRQRGVARAIVSANGIRTVLQLPELNAPVSRVARDSLYGQVRADEDLMQVAADEYADLITEDPSSPPEMFSPAAQLFSGWSPTDAQRACQMDPRLLNQLALGTLAPLPRPGREAIQRARWVIRGASREAGWTRLALRAVDAWVDENCAAVSDWDGRGDADLAEEQRAERAKDWPSYAQAIIGFRGDPLRVQTITEVSLCIRRAFEVY